MVPTLKNGGHLRRSKKWHQDATGATLTRYLPLQFLAADHLALAGNNLQLRTVDDNQLTPDQPDHQADAPFLSAQPSRATST